MPSVETASGGGNGATSGSESEALERTDAALFKALEAGDVQSLEGLLADEFLIVDVAGGSVHSRAAFLEAIGDGTVDFEQIRPFPEEAVIRFAGPDVGLIVGRTAISFRGPDGAVAEFASRYTHVFKRRGTDWQVFSAQGTPIG